MQTVNDILKDLRKRKKADSLYVNISNEKDETIYGNWATSSQLDEFGNLKVIDGRVSEHIGNIFILRVKK